MNTVRLVSKYNSTMFTTCCDTAILPDEACCPRCGVEVYPGKDATNHERERKRWDMAYRSKHPVQTSPSRTK